MKVLILCGGRGVIDFERRIRIPKGMIYIGERPVIWHVMKAFSTYGHKDFILALGEKGDEIRNYFLNYNDRVHDIEIRGAENQITYLNRIAEEDWNIKIVDTGLGAHTGSRIARCRRYLNEEAFLMTYSDCLCGVNLNDLLDHHKKNKKIITVTGVQPTSRFGTFYCKDDQVTGYSLDAKTTGIGGYINGGFMVMEPEIFNYIDAFNECMLEKEPFVKLADQKKVAVFPYTGYWQAMDTERDALIVNDLYARNQRPWLPDAQALHSEIKK